MFLNWNTLEEDFMSHLTETTRNKYKIEEKENGFIIKIETPGVEKEKIDITVENSLLKVKVENKKTHSFNIKDLDINTIKANYNNGLLCIEVSKEKGKTKKVKIN
jgi:HSP20 family molecular chaperone IbpA